MANTVDRTLNKVGNVIEDILGVSRPQREYLPSRQVKNQTCLEKVGMAARDAQLMRNGWRKDLEYSKPLVDAEYLVQTEFYVS